MPPASLSENLYFGLGMAVLLASAAPVFILGGAALLSRGLSERATGRLLHSATVIGLSASIIILAMMLYRGDREVRIVLGDWVHVAHAHHAPPAGPGLPAENTLPHAEDALQKHELADEAGVYHFAVKFVFDRLSVPFAIMTFSLCGVVGAFAFRYLHREPGYDRFFLLYAFFVLGMVMTSLAGTIETLFSGWELVGLSSAMLVAFYQDRAAPVRNGLRVWTVYRISDAALLLASVAMHHLHGHGDFDKFLGHHPLDPATTWPGGDCAVTVGQGLLVGFLLLAAAAGKSALIPFSGWLPRAMEGPTPSSAVFYGALSVHLGAFLLLRFSPLLDQAPAVAAVAVALGLATSAFAALVGRVQTDVKSALSFASLSQVGLIVAEIGLGLRYLALIHILGHACFRTLQFIRAPNLISDFRNIENAVGQHLPRLAAENDSWIPLRWRSWLYRFALEKGYLDAFLTDYLVLPLLAGLRYCNGWERSWTNFLAGSPTAPPASEAELPPPSPVEEPVR